MVFFIHEGEYIVGDALTPPLALLQNQDRVPRIRAIKLDENGPQGPIRAAIVHLRHVSIQ